MGWFRRREQLAGLRISVRAMDDIGASGREIRTLDDCPLGIVMADLQRDIKYANQAARSTLGIGNIERASLDRFFASESARTTLDEQITRRRSGEVGNYVVAVRRGDDEREIPVEVIGLPVTDESRHVIGTCAIFISLEQRRLSAQLYAAINNIGDEAELARVLATSLKNVFPSELMIVSRYSQDMRHVQMTFVNGHKFTDFALRKRWMPLDERQSEWMESNPLLRIDDIRESLNSDTWKRNKDEPIVREILGAGFKSTIRRLGFSWREASGIYLSLQSQDRCLLIRP